MREAAPRGKAGSGVEREREFLCVLEAFIRIFLKGDLDRLDQVWRTLGGPTLEFWWWFMGLLVEDRHRSEAIEGRLSCERMVTDNAK